MEKNIILLKGFSLIELLISLIIISLITSAFAPVVIKNLKKNSVSISQNNSNITSDCNDIDSECELCYKNKKCITCTKTCPNKQYVDNETCKCVDCPDKCTSCDKNQCISCITDYKLQADKKDCIPDFVVPDKDKCTKINALFIPAEQNGINGKAICITKQNAGDALGAPIPSGVQKIGVDHKWNPVNCMRELTTSACWLGNTSPYKYSTPSDANPPFDYSGWYRSVCNWYAANEICSKYTIAQNGIVAERWRLPEITEFKGWGDNLDILNKKTGSAGMQLCDRFKGYNTPVCEGGGTGCNGAIFAYCTPYYLHGKNSMMTLETGKITAYEGKRLTTAASVRCVIDKLYEY